MTQQELLASPEAREQYEKLVIPPETRAAGYKDHWDAYTAGREDNFYYYFMLEAENKSMVEAHDKPRRLFLSTIGAKTEIPYYIDTPQIVLKTGSAVLWAASQGRDDGDPFAVEYTATRVFYPVQ